LYDRYINDMKKVGTKQRLLNEDQFGIELRRLIPRIENDKVMMNDDGRRVVTLIGDKRPELMDDRGVKRRVWCHLIPPLMIVRDCMSFLFKRKLIWDQAEEWEQPEEAPL
jgi:hypothetical protein